MIVPLHGPWGMSFGILFFIAVLFELKIKAERNIQFIVIVMTLYSLGFLMMPGHLDFFEMDRYFSVVTPMVYLLIMLMVENKLQGATRTIRACVYATIFIWLCYPLTRTFNNTQAWHERSCSADNGK